MSVTASQAYLAIDILGLGEAAPSYLSKAAGETLRRALEDPNWHGGGPTCEPYGKIPSNLSPEALRAVAMARLAVAEMEAGAPLERLRQILTGI